MRRESTKPLMIPSGWRGDVRPEPAVVLPLTWSWLILCSLVSLSCWSLEYICMSLSLVTSFWASSLCLRRSFSTLRRASCSLVATTGKQRSWKEEGGHSEWRQQEHQGQVGAHRDYWLIVVLVTLVMAGGVRQHTRWPSSILTGGSICFRWWFNYF